MAHRTLALACAAALAWGALHGSGCVTLVVEPPGGGDGDDDGGSSSGGEGGGGGSGDLGPPASPFVRSSEPDLDLRMPDRMGYDGSIESMICVPLTVPQEWGYTEVREVRATVAIDHPWAGDLVIKVVSPRRTVTTVLSRPGYEEPFDSDYRHGREGSDLDGEYPITFRDGAPIAAEEMGATLSDEQVICRDDQRCDHAPSPGRGPGTSLADFRGEDPSGTWQICIADASSGDGDTGTLQRVRLWLDVQ